jgi:hypothetical protein
MPDQLTEVKQAVAELSSAVRDLASPERIQGIVHDVLAGQSVQRRSYQPDDVDGGLSPFGFGLPDLQGRDRFEQMHGLPPVAVAEALHRPVGDVVELQSAGDSLVLLTAYLRQTDEQFSGDPRDTDFYRESYLPRLQALDTATTAEGVEWVPKELSGNLIERVNLALQVAGLFPSVAMPTNPFDISGLAIARQRGGKASEQTADTGQTGFKKITPATRKVTLTAVKFAVEAIISRELEEDAIVAMLPFLQEELVDYISADIEDAIVNGDTAGTHQDSDVTAATDPRKNFEGLRKRALAAAKTDAANALLTAAMLRETVRRWAATACAPTNSCTSSGWART